MPKGIYKRTIGVNCGLNKGKHWNLSVKTKEKMSLFRIGKIPKVAGWNKGKHHSEETKKKIGASNKISQRGKKLSEKTKKKIGLANRGEKSHFWKGGVSKLKRYKHYNNIDYRKWRKLVFERDNYTCQECGNKSKKGNPVIIHPHHIKSYTKYPELRYNINNGITLCILCHHRIHWGH